MAIPLGKPRDKADRPDKPPSLRVAAKCGVCVVALLGFVVLATTFVARLASLRILPATQSAEDLIRGSLLHSIMSGVSLRKPCLSILARHLCGLKARRGRPHSNGALTSYQRTDKRPLKPTMKEGGNSTSARRSRFPKVNSTDAARNER